MKLAAMNNLGPISGTTAFALLAGSVERSQDILASANPTSANVPSAKPPAESLALSVLKHVLESSLLLADVDSNVQASQSASQTIQQAVKQYRESSVAPVMDISANIGAEAPLGGGVETLAERIANMEVAASGFRLQAAQVADWLEQGRPANAPNMQDFQRLSEEQITNWMGHVNANAMLIEVQAASIINALIHQSLSVFRKRVASKRSALRKQTR